VSPESSRATPRSPSHRYHALIADLSEVEALIAGAEAETRRLLEDVRRLGDDDVRSSSSLPGWTRGHVLTHLARNADAQARLLAGALRDERVEQYQGGLVGRAAEIEERAHRPARALRQDVEQSAERLRSIWQLMSVDTWERPAAGAIAGERPAWATVWARWSEVSIHHVDLAIGYTPSHWSLEFVDRVIRRSLPRTKSRLIADEGISITAPDLGLSWESSPSPGIQVQGPSYAIVAWLAGRTGPWLELVSTSRGGVSASLPRVKPWA